MLKDKRDLLLNPVENLVIDIESIGSDISEEYIDSCFMDLESLDFESFDNDGHAIIDSEGELIELTEADLEFFKEKLPKETKLVYSKLSDYTTIVDIKNQMLSKAVEFEGVDNDVLKIFRGCASFAGMTRFLTGETFKKHLLRVGGAGVVSAAGSTLAGNAAAKTMNVVMAGGKASAGTVAGGVVGMGASVIGGTLATAGVAVNLYKILTQNTITKLRKKAGIVVQMNDIFIKESNLKLKEMGKDKKMITRYDKFIIDSKSLSNETMKDAEAMEKISITIDKYITAKPEIAGDLIKMKKAFESMHRQIGIIRKHLVSNIK